MTKQKQIFRLFIIVLGATVLFFGGRELYYMRSMERYPLLVEMDQQKLQTEADFVIRGSIEKLLGSIRYIDAAGELTVATRWRVVVAESLKGHAPETLVVRTLGGRYGLTELWVEDGVVFTPGEEVVLYLVQDANSDDFQVVGMFQGHFTQSGDTLIQQETQKEESFKDLKSSIQAAKDL